MSARTVYEFYDGDFTFHVLEYDNPADNYLFRVRINQDPEERARQNVTNANRGRPGWRRLRPATRLEAVGWIFVFERYYPERLPWHTQALRHLRLHGPCGTNFDVTLHKGCRELTVPRLVVRDFQPERLRLVEPKGALFDLTAAGRWLTSLMK